MLPVSILNKNPIVVFGAGAYGTALALNFHLSKKNVVLLPGRLDEVDDLIASKKKQSLLAWGLFRKFTNSSRLQCTL